MTLPQMSGSPVVTDGGLETDLIYHHGVDLPDFASFPLVEDEKGAALLRAYYDGYVDIARRAGTALQLETPTWRASADWGARLGYTRGRPRPVQPRVGAAPAGDPRPVGTGGVRDQRQPGSAR